MKHITAAGFGFFQETEAKPLKASARSFQKLRLWANQSANLAGVKILLP